jgi:hypothetical protein
MSAVEQFSIGESDVVSPGDDLAVVSLSPDGLTTPSVRSFCKTRIALPKPPRTLRDRPVLVRRSRPSAQRGQLVPQARQLPVPRVRPFRNTQISRVWRWSSRTLAGGFYQSNIARSLILVPAAAAIPAATTEQKNDNNDDEKGFHREFSFAP